MRRKRNEKAEAIKCYIEDIIENYNAYIQLAFLILILCVTALGFLSEINSESIIINLLIIISSQFLIQGIKDSIGQKKLNILTANLNIELGRLFRVDDSKMDQYFEQAQTSFFISGITLSDFFHVYKKRITQFLSDGKKFYVLIADPDIIAENTKLYHGTKNNNKEHIKNIIAVLNKQKTTLDAINISKWINYLENGQLQIRLSKAVFSTSFVTYDWDCSTIDGREKKIKASFYQYGCTESSEEPNICIDNIHSREWYIFFENTITRQWNDAEQIKTAKEFESLCDKLDKLQMTYAKKKKTEI